MSEEEIFHVIPVENGIGFCENRGREEEEEEKEGGGKRKREGTGGRPAQLLPPGPVDWSPSKPVTGREEEEECILVSFI